MRSMSFRAGLAAFLAGLALTTSAFCAELPRAAPAEVGLSPERLDKITAVLKNDVAQKTSSAVCCSSPDTARSPISRRSARAIRKKRADDRRMRSFASTR